MILAMWNLLEPIAYAHLKCDIYCLQSGELEDKIHHLEAENVSLRAQLEDSASKVVHALKDGKAKDAELEALRSKLASAQKQVAELTKANQELSSSMAKAEGTLQRAATLSGLDESVRQEFNEVSCVPLFPEGFGVFRRWLLQS